MDGGTKKIYPKNILRKRPQDTFILAKKKVVGNFSLEDKGSQTH